MSEIFSTVRGHPFMTSTRRGEGVRLRWTHVDGGRGSSPMWTSTQKIKIRVHLRHTVFLSCKEVGVFFNRISSLDRKKWKFFCDINSSSLTKGPMPVGARCCSRYSTPFLFA